MNLFSVMRVFVTCVLSGFFISASLYASQDIVLQQDQIIGREKQRQDELLKQFRELTPPKEAPVEPSSNVSDNTKQFGFDEIVIEGATLLSDDEKRDLVRSYLKREISVDEINEVLRKITNIYVERGYITSRAYLKPQDLTFGRLTITVVEGCIESLIVQRNGQERNINGVAIPASEGEVLNIRDLEQGIDQITRLRTCDAAIDLQPGEKDGASRVQIRTNQERPFFVGGYVDNYGSKSTGENQAELQIGLEDIFGIYDAWLVNLRTNLDHSDADHHSRSLVMQGSVPIGYWTLRYAGSFFDYLSTVEGQLHQFRFSGNSQNHRVELEHILHRDGMGKTGVTFFFNHKIYRNYVERSLLQVGSYTLTTVGGNLFHARRLLSGVFTASLGYTQGTRWLNALKNSQTPIRGSNPQFSKFILDMSYMKPFGFWGQDFCFISQASGQYTHQSLVSNERISVGGPQTVRGYNDTGLSGDIGLYVHNDLSWSLWKPSDVQLYKFIGEFQLFGGFDYGWIRQDKYDNFERGVLRSISYGARLKNGGITGDATIAKSLSRPAFLKKENTVFQLRVGMSF